MTITAKLFMSGHRGLILILSAFLRLLARLAGSAETFLPRAMSFSISTKNLVMAGSVCSAVSPSSAVGHQGVLPAAKVCHPMT